MVSYALNDLPSPSDNRYPGKRDSILFASVSPIPSTGSGAQKVLNKHLQNESAFCYELIHRCDSGKYSTEGRHSWMVWGRPGDGRALGGGPGARLWSVMRTSRARIGSKALPWARWPLACGRRQGRLRMGMWYPTLMSISWTVQRHTEELRDAFKRWRWEARSTAEASQGPALVICRTFGAPPPYPHTLGTILVVIYSSSLQTFQPCSHPYQKKKDQTTTLEIRISKLQAKYVYFWIDIFYLKNLYLK